MYSMLSFFGTNMVTTEDEEWKRHRKVAAPSFQQVRPRPLSVSSRGSPSLISLPASLPSGLGSDRVQYVRVSLLFHLVSLSPDLTAFFPLLSHRPHDGARGLECS